MKFGQIVVHPLTDGRFRLDGGAMFGVVPRVMWEKLAPPDEAHRIPLRPPAAHACTPLSIGIWHVKLPSRACYGNDR